MVEKIKAISTEEVKNLIDSDSDNYILIDVRENEELENGMIPTAKNIPMGEIAKAFKKDEEDFEPEYGFITPSKDKTIIFYCRTGPRGEYAAKIALNAGFDAQVYEGSILEWSKIDSNVKMYGES